MTTCKQALNRDPFGRALGTPLFADGSGGRVLAAVFKPPAVVTGLDDVTVVGNAPISLGSQRGGHLGIAEHGRPLPEREVGGDDQRSALVELADEVEQQLTTRASERQVAKLVEHDEVEARELGRECPCLGAGFEPATFRL